jgi:acyl-CoA synthetase (AMP-forming)/AMP-acid ligase II
MTHSAPVTNIAGRLGHLAESRGNHPALIELTDRAGPPRVMSFAELDRYVCSCAAGLLQHGITRGTRVVLFVPMSVDLYVVILALFRVGAVAVFIDPWSGRSTIESAVQQVQARAFIGVPKAHLLRFASRSIRHLPLHVVAGSGIRSRVAARLSGSILLPDLLRSRPVSEGPRDVTAGDPALITFTGGSTGSPKGADRTHGFLAAQQETLTRNITLDSTDRCLTNLPIVVLHGLERGVTVVIPPAGMAQDPNMDGAQLATMIRTHAIDVLALSPAPLEHLATAARHEPITSVKRVYTGGGPVLPHVLAHATTALPHSEIVTIYGSTEAEPIAHAPGSESLSRHDTQRSGGGVWIGNPVPDIAFRIITPHPDPIVIAAGSSLQDWCVTAGSPGELIVSGAHVNERYVGNPQAVRAHKVWDEHGRCWHRTGDIVRADPDGSLWLLGRIDQQMSLNGRTRWPLEIEVPLMERPEIARAAIVMRRRESGEGTPLVIAIEPAPGVPHKAAHAAAVDTLRLQDMQTYVLVRVLGNIPMDARHGAKVDQSALLRALDR